jgi:hypothetical protein
MLNGLDVLVIDLQDIGARIYTYIYTMANCLRACGRHGVPVIVCDRPNPINGIDVEGQTLVPGFESFVGLFSDSDAPWDDHRRAGGFLQPDICARRDCRSRPNGRLAAEMYADDTDLPWVMPSPNMPTLDTAIVYPGTVLFEGTMLSEGRGTTRRSSWLARPWIEAERFAREMNACASGCVLPAAVFEPTFQKAREDHVRRLPDSRDRSRVVPAGAHRRRADRQFRRLNPDNSRGGSRRTSTSTTSCRSTSLPGRARCGSRLKRSRPERHRRAAGATMRPLSGKRASRFFCINHEAREERSTSSVLAHFVRRVLAIPGALISCGVGGIR